MTVSGSSPLRIGIVGDIILDAPLPGRFFDPARAALAGFDVLIGHVEMPHTLGGEQVATLAPVPTSPPAHLEAVVDAGLHVATLAGNHIADRGASGIRDTVNVLAGGGVATTGAGPDEAAAWAPAVVEVAGRRIGVLSVNAVGPDFAQATSGKAGAAQLDVRTIYGAPFGGPGGVPTTTDTWVPPAEVRRLGAAVVALRERVDVVVVALHQGLLHVPATIADYERTLAHAAIDAGAHVVAAHHAHILKGIDVYRGRPIFYGLGNFVTVTSAMSDQAGNAPERRRWAAQRRGLLGFTPDPAMPLYPFHPDSRHTMIATLDVVDEGPSAGFVPCWIDYDARPVPLEGDAGERTVDYVRVISAEAGFGVAIEWDGRHARVHSVPSREGIVP